MRRVIGGQAKRHKLKGRTGICFANGIGDHLMVLPAVRALVTLCSAPPIYFGMTRLARLVFADVELGETIDIGLSNRDGRNVFDAEAVAMPDVALTDVVSLNPWHSADLARLLARLRPARSVGMHPDLDVWAQPHPSDHSADRAFRVARQLAPGYCIETFDAPPSLSLEAKRAAAAQLARLPPDRKLLAVHNETLLPKRWPKRRLQETLRAFLAASPDFDVIALGVENDDFDELRDEQRYLVPKHLELGVAFGLVSQADLFLGADSCMLHAADLFRVPGVGLFGPSAESALGSAEMGFRFGPHVHVNGQGAMTDVGVPEVLAALAQLRPDAQVAARRLPR